MPGSAGKDCSCRIEVEAVALAILHTVPGADQREPDKRELRFAVTTCLKIESGGRE